MAASPFHLSPCTPADVPSMMSIYSLAFSHDHLSSYTFPPSIPTSTKEAWLATRFLRTFSQPNIRNFKIVETSTGQMVAWARWGFPHVFTVDELAEKERQRKEVEEEGEWPEGANLEVCAAKFGGLETKRDKWIEEAETYSIPPFLSPNVI